MFIPKLLHGRQSDVRKACERVVREIARGARYLEVMGPLVDSRVLPGNFILTGGRGTTGDALHFHCYSITHALDKATNAKRVPIAVAEDVVTTSLGHTWGLLTLMGMDGDGFLVRFHQGRTFLDAIQRHWNELVAEGPRYAFHTLPPQELWQVPTTITVELADAGVPATKLQGGLTSAGLEPFGAYLLRT
jgi:hypothetical protein